MIRAELVNGELAVVKLDKLSINMLVRVKAFMTRFAFDLARYVQSEKLTGQVLKVQTGNLKKSLMRGVGVVETPSGVIGTVGLGGADLKVAKYGGVHEYGFKGEVAVKAFARKSGIAVRAHTRKINLPVRSFLRSSLKDKKPAFERGLQDAINNAAKDSE